MINILDFILKYFKEESDRIQSRFCKDFSDNSLKNVFETVAVD